MGKVFRIEEMAKSDEEKELIVKALTDKAFRDSLQQRIDEEGAELSDSDMDQVVGGAFLPTLSTRQISSVWQSVKYVEGLISKGVEVLCG